MTSYSKAKRQNDEFTRELKSWFTVLPRALLVTTVSYTLGKVMQPDRRNYQPSRGDFVTGNLMPHGSSNAAFNWRIGWGKTENPVTYAYGVDGVGMPYDTRSDNNDTEMYTVMENRHQNDMRLLVSQAFASYKKSIPKVYIYNKISGSYAENANLSAVTNYATVHFNVGMSRAKQIVDSYKRTGRVNAKALEGYIRSLYV